MQDRPNEKIFLGFLRICRLLIRYIYLHIQLYFLLLQRFLLKCLFTVLKAAIHLWGAAMIGALEVVYSIKSLSNESRIVFAACIALSMYLLALNFILRM